MRPSYGFPKRWWQIRRTGRRRALLEPHSHHHPEAGGRSRRSRTPRTHRAPTAGPERALTSRLITPSAAHSESLAGLGRPHQGLLRPRVPHFELRHRIHAVLKEEVLDRVRLLARATVFVRERPVLHALEVDLRTRLPFGCCQDVGRGPMSVAYVLRSGLHGNMSTGGRLPLPREPLHKSDGPRAGVLHVLRLGATTSRGHSYGEEERRPMGPPAPNTIVGTV
jgi:hypothetical protein